MASIAAREVWDRTIGYLRRNRLRKVVAVFGGLLATILAVMAIAAARGDFDLVGHIANREFAVHIGLGFGLYALFWVVTSILQRRRGRRFDWRVRYYLPVAMLLAINATNEWGIAMTPKPKYCYEPAVVAQGGCGFLGGDWARALKGGDPPLMLKSIADMAAWAFGALATAWFLYKEADGIWEARHDRLQWQVERAQRK